MPPSSNQHPVIRELVLFVEEHDLPADAVVAAISNYTTEPLHLNTLLRWKRGESGQRPSQAIKEAVQQYLVAARGEADKVAGGWRPVIRGATVEREAGARQEVPEAERRAWAAADELLFVLAQRSASGDQLNPVETAERITRIAEGFVDPVRTYLLTYARRLTAQGVHAPNR